MVSLINISYEKRYGHDRAIIIKEKISKSVKELYNDISYREKYLKSREKVRLKLKGKTYEEIYGTERAKQLRELRRLKMLGHKCRNETKIKLRKYFTGKKNIKCSETKRALAKKGLLTPWNKGLTKETDERVRRYSEKVSNSIIKLYTEHPEKREEAILNILHSQKIVRRPTIPEQKVINVISKGAFPFKYIGNNKLLINGKNPDFISTNENKNIIEVFGIYWHGNFPNAEERILLEKERQNIFCEAGYRTLIIWEDELRQENSIAERIKTFIGGNTMQGDLNG